MNRGLSPWVSELGTFRSTKKFLRTVKRRGRLAGQRVGAGDAPRRDAILRQGRRGLERDAGLAVLAGDDERVPVGGLDEPLAGLELRLDESPIGANVSLRHRVAESSLVRRSRSARRLLPSRLVGDVAMRRSISPTSRPSALLAIAACGLPESSPLVACASRPGADGRGWSSAPAGAGAAAHALARRPPALGLFHDALAIGLVGRDRGRLLGLLDDGLRHGDRRGRVAERVGRLGRERPGAGLVVEERADRRQRVVEEPQAATGRPSRSTARPRPGGRAGRRS